MALGVGLYAIPLGMIANPSLIRLETDLLGALGAFLKMCLGLVCISHALIAVRIRLLKVVLLLPGLLIVFARLLVEAIVPPGRPRFSEIRCFGAGPSGQGRGVTYSGNWVTANSIAR